jgi:hypothetical protein
MENKFLVGCDCGCNAILISKFDENNDSPEYDLDLVAFLVYYSREKRKSVFTNLSEKLKMIWYIARGKDYLLYETVFDSKDWKRFKEFIKDS